MLEFASRRRATFLAATEIPTPPFPDDGAIRGLFDGIFPTRRAGAIVGLIDNDTRRIVTVNEKNTLPLDENAIFEIASVTKAFTGTILGDMVVRSQVHLDDPVAMYLPNHIRIPRWDGRDITLQHLATHTSGLPPIPSNMPRRFTRNPYKGYTEEKLYQFLHRHSLRHDPGSRYDYSNLGVGLLGHALARRAGTSFEELVTTRITSPLAMHDTRITMTPNMSDRLLRGYNRFGIRTPHWDMGCLGAAGALRSSIHDLLKFLAAAMLSNTNEGEQSLFQPMVLATTGRIGSGSTRVGLCWHTLHRGESELVWHNGATFGFSSFLAFNRFSRRGIVILSNSRGPVDSVGFRLMKPL